MVVRKVKLDIITPILWSEANYPKRDGFTSMPSRKIDQLPNEYLEQEIVHNDHLLNCLKINVRVQAY